MKNFSNPQDILNSTNLIDHFLDLVKIDTMSDENSESCPSTKGQLEAMNVVREKLLAIGLKDAVVDENGYVYATLATNQDKAPAIGFIAHVDTSPDAPGNNIKPIFHENYDGSAIKLKNGITIDPEDDPEIKQCVGHTIITADGTTLLGADDKAGIAEILAALEILVKNPDIPRPNLRIAFTPDEEIGRGADKFNYDKFAADCAYTLDAESIGQVNTETFNAESATVTITGVPTHPGFAKDKMVNAMKYAARFLEKIPAKERAETTEDREGFFHFDTIKGGSTECVIKMIVRDHDLSKMKQRGQVLEQIKNDLLKEEPRLKIDVKLVHSYYNMGEELAKHPKVVDKLLEAVKLSGLEPTIVPVRGGTDGARLTAQGLPTPNIFTGMMNFHGYKEWASTTGMGYSTCTVLNLLQLWTK